MLDSSSGLMVWTGCLLEGISRKGLNSLSMMNRERRKTSVSRRDRLLVVRLSLRHRVRYQLECSTVDGFGGPDDSFEEEWDVLES